MEARSGVRAWRRARSGIVTREYRSTQHRDGRPDRAAVDGSALPRLHSHARRSQGGCRSRPNARSALPAGACFFHPFILRSLMSDMTAVRVGNHESTGEAMNLREARQVIGALETDPDAARVFGKTYETADGATVIPVTTVRRGSPRPAGVSVVKDGRASWVPAVAGE